MSEQVMCFPSKIFKGKFDFEKIDELRNQVVYKPRSLVETDLSFRHAIGYVILLQEEVKPYDSRVFIYERKGSEKRLHGQFSIGIGGHVNDDLYHEPLSKQIREAALREIQEEAGIKPHRGSLIYLDHIALSTSEVDMVHVGFLFAHNCKGELNLDNELAGGEWIEFRKLKNNFADQLESWSKHAMSTLEKHLYRRCEYRRKWMAEYRKKQKEDGVDFTEDEAGQAYLESQDVE